MTRYSSIEEVDSALIDLASHERKVASEKPRNDKYSDIEKPISRTNSGNVSLNRQNLLNGIEENGENVAGESNDSESGSGTIEDNDGNESDGENLHDEVGESEDYDNNGDQVSDEDEVRVRQKAPEVDSQEEADFDRELRALMQESLDSRKLELRSRPTINMMIPMNVFEGPSNKDHHHHGRFAEGESDDSTMDEGSGVTKEVKVKVLVKHGNKQQTKQMYIPHDCSLVQSTKQKEAAQTVHVLTKLTKTGNRVARTAGLGT